MDRSFEGLDQRLADFEWRVDRRFETLERRFRWLIGLQAMTIGSVLAAFATLARRLRCCS